MKLSEYNSEILRSTEILDSAHLRPFMSRRASFCKMVGGKSFLLMYPQSFSREL